MKATSKKIAGLVAGGALVVSAAPAAQLAVADEASGLAGQGGATAACASSEASAVVANQVQQVIKHVQGTFNWNQDVATDNETLAKSLYRSSDYLCGAQGAEAAAAGEAAGAIESIAVKGDVGNAFVANVEEFTKKAPAKKVMGCTCSGNPADGRASANAEVSGFRLAALVDEAAPVEGANAITFTCRDGYQVKLPLDYVMQRYSLIVTMMNGDEASDAVGCANQLWLGSTAARSFARDVVEISITKEAEAPDAPGANPDANTPNVGVTEGTALA